MKKILLINNTYPSSLNKKKGSYVKSIFENLQEAGFDVQKIVLNSNYNNSATKIFHYIKFYFRLLTFEKYDTYDYIYIHHYPQVFLPILPKLRKMKRIVINFHGNDIIGNSWFNEAINYVSYMFLPDVDFYIVPSEYFKKQVFYKLPKLKSQKFYISPSGGVDTCLFKPTKREHNRSKTVIGFASGINKNKGIEDLILLAKKLEPEKYTFYVINYGVDKEHYINKLKSFRNVKLFEVLPKNEMPKFYTEIDVLFFPTKRESLGLVALEAMSCNVPVIGPNDFALEKIIQSSITGEKYNPKEKCGFLEAFKNYRHNYLKYEPRKYILDNFSKKKVVEQLKLIFE